MTLKNKNIIILLCILFLGSILRTPITGVGSIIGLIKEILHINNTVAGFITTIPLFAFAIISPFASKISKKYGLEKTLLYATIIITLGLFIRFFISVNTLFVSTFLLGTGIAIGNVLLPAFTKKYYPEKLGIMTGVFTVTMTVSASFAAAISYPIASANIISKEFSLSLALNIWIVIALIAICIYYIFNKTISSHQEKIIGVKDSHKNIFKHSKLYTITLSMGLQSALFYSSVSWFGEIMISKGFSASEAGFLISMSQFAQFPSTFLLPIIADKIKNKMIIPILIVLAYLSALVGMMFLGTNISMMIIMMILYALAGGGSFSYVMYLFSSKTRNTEEASKISGIAQSGGYILAGIFPPMLGYVKDISNWNNTIVILMGASLILLVTLVHCSSKGNIIKE